MRLVAFAVLVSTTRWLHASAKAPYQPTCKTDQRAAICFFGQVKNINQSHVASFVANVLMPVLELYPQIDIYLHTYDIKRFTNPRNGEDHVPINVQRSMSLLVGGVLSCRTCNRVKLKGVVVSEPAVADRRFRNLQYYLSRGDPWDNQGLSMKYFLRQLYSLDKVTELWHGPCGSDRMYGYDMIMYTRPDLIFFDELSLVGRGGGFSDTETEHEITTSELQPHTIYTPNFDTFEGLNDRFAFGTPSVMHIYGSRMHFIDYYFQQRPQTPLWAEPYLRDIVVDMWGFKSSYLHNFTFARVRADGRVGVT